MSHMERLCIKGVRNLADTLGISVSAAHSLTKRQDFPSARIGKTIVVPVAALKEWLAKGGTDQKGA